MTEEQRGRTLQEIARTERKLDVLDHGFVRLVDWMGSDLSIVRAARVSYDADWRAGENEKSDHRLIRYLMKNKHTSPFEAVNVTLEIKCPLFVARQWHRHRTWAYNEISARYTTLDEGFFLPQIHSIGRQSPDNKQARIIDDQISGDDWVIRREFLKDLEEHNLRGFAMYERYLESGIPRELARCFLEVNAYTRYFGTVDLHNLFHFLRLRLHEHAQLEVREYALAILILLEEFVAPVAVEAFKETL